LSHKLAESVTTSVCPAHFVPLIYQDYLSFDVHTQIVTPTSDVKIRLFASQEKKMYFIFVCKEL
jgi:hypothetical protein